MTLTLHEHPFAAYCWKPLIALARARPPVQRRLVEDEEARARLAELWPLASIPVLVDDDAGLTLPDPRRSSSMSTRSPRPPLIPADPAGALQARLWIASSMATS